jgi:hypothetical protein
MGVDAFRVRQREVAAPDAGLVGDDEEFEAGVRQPFQRRARAGENLHVFRPVQIIFFHDQRAVAVEKNGSVHSADKLWLQIVARMELNYFSTLRAEYPSSLFSKQPSNSHEQRQTWNFGRRRSGARLNGVISAATIEGINQGYEVIGFRDGFKYLAQGDTTQIKPLSIRDVKDIHLKGGSILGTARTNPTKSEEQMKNFSRVRKARHHRAGDHRRR